MFKKRSLIALFHDLFMSIIAFVAALYWRLGDGIYWITPQVTYSVIALLFINAIIFIRFRLYKGIWRYASIPDMIAITKSVSLSLVCFIIFLFIISRLDWFPRSVLILQWIMTLFALGGPRIAWRIVRDRQEYFESLKNDYQRPIPLLLIGLTRESEMLLREIARGNIQQYEVAAILVNEAHKWGQDVFQTRIMGGYDSAARVIQKLQKRQIKLRKILIADPYLSTDILRILVQLSEQYGLTIARLPQLTDFQATLADPLSLKPLVIEDLLGRAQHTYDNDVLIDLVKNKTILVTGAGGTIGAELVRQLSEFQPKSIILIEQSELNLYHIDKELAEQHPHIPRYSYIADIRCENRIGEIFNQHRPQIIYHAAALKHVPLVETNAREAIKTNLLGTAIIAQQARKYHAQIMVLISSDKAVYPTNVLGATKRAAELYFTYLNSQPVKANGTHFTTVRFGNVLGSSGSVIPLFQEQISRKGPVTVTHPDIERYFMTVREAVELVLHSTHLARTNPKNGVYVLDMGTPIKIKDLAEQMITMAGLRVGTDIPIVYTGIRPGEKLYEELFYNDETILHTTHPIVRLALSTTLSSAHMKQFEQLMIQCETISDEESALLYLSQLVHDFNHQKS
jgi:FlaA1/EpsC-like NDP-sugar epimerase